MSLLMMSGRGVQLCARAGAFVFALVLALVSTHALSQSQDIDALFQRFRKHYEAGQYAQADAVERRLVALLESRLGKDHPAIVPLLQNLALLHQAQARYEAAAQLYVRTKTIREKALGSEHPDVAQSVTGLANVYEKQGRYEEAARLHQRALAIREKAYGAAHPEVAHSLHNLANVHEAEARFDEAAQLYTRAMAILEKALGSEHPDVAKSVNNLANVHERQGRYDEAAQLHARALAIREKAFEATHWDVGQSLNNLANVRERQGRYEEAAQLHARGLAIREKALGAAHPDVAASLNNLALVYYQQGRYDEAARLYARALAILEKALGPAHREVALNLNNMAVVHETQGRYEEAARLYARALAIREKALGTAHPEVAHSVNNLANVHQVQGRHEEAARLLERALAIQEKAFGSGHPDVATSLNNLANARQAQGRYQEAARLHTQALRVREQALGGQHPDVAHSLSNLAVVYRAQGSYEEAAGLYARALAIREQALGTAHPDVAQSLHGLGLIARAQGRWSEAHAAFARAAAIQVGRLGIARDGGEGAPERHVFRGLAEAAWHLAHERPDLAPALADEAFTAAQWATFTSTGDALSQMAARLAAAGGGVAPLVREAQDLAAARRAADKRLIEALGAPADNRNETLVVTLRAEIERIDARMKSLQSRLERDFPEFVELAKPNPVAIADVQALLGPEAALVTYLLGDTESFVWAVTRDGMRWERLDASERSAADLIARLRRSIDAHIERGFADLTETADCGAARDTDAGERAAGKPSCAELGLFDLALAHDLYKALLGPVADLVRGKPQLIVVPAGPLTSLPFNALVTDPPGAGHRGREAYRQAAWLVRRHAVTVLPSVSSLRALRQYAKASRASKPFVGFGDPVFGKIQSGPRGRRAASKQRAATRELATYFRGALADRGELGKLAPLPNTADELRAMARSLAAGDSDIVLGRAATEAAVKTMSARGQLSHYRVVAFATHGLVAGEIKGLAEPGLVLSLPELPSPADDGLLTASEVATLTLDADWVILSACNTAAGDKPGAEALSGLARTFFYAGTRALLVSHWPVETQAAEFLTTQTFAELHTAAAHQPIGRSEALRRAMLALLQKEPHPAVWAPFMVVGEGEAKR